MKAGKLSYSALASRMQRLEAERVERIDRERYLKLQQMANHRVFDINKEFERVKYSRKNGMTDQQFAEHVETIIDNYQPTGLGNMPFPVDMVASSPVPDSPRKASKPMQYSQKTVEKAVKYCCEKREQGNEVDYATVLEKINARPVAGVTDHAPGVSGSIG